MDNRKIAENVINRAREVIMTERGTSHGDAENSFQMIADMWAAYINHLTLRRTGKYPRVALTGFDVAQMMVQLKQARAIYGDGANQDHYIDGIGYTALAAMLSGTGRDANMPKADVGFDPDVVVTDFNKWEATLTTEDLKDAK